MGVPVRGLGSVSDVAVVLATSHLLPISAIIMTRCATALAAAPLAAMRSRLY